MQNFSNSSAFISVLHRRARQKILEKGFVTYIHACMHTYIHTYIHTYSHTLTHKILEKGFVFRYF